MTFFGGAGMICLEAWVDLCLALTFIAVSTAVLALRFWGYVGTNLPKFDIKFHPSLWM